MIDIARRNFQTLKANPYPGRGIVIGLDEEAENLIQIYWIMGRSANSRNRIFEAEGTTLRTAAADPAKVKDPSLIIYTAMDEVNGAHIVSNGDQTDTIATAVECGANFIGALRTREYEPDEPNFTPRISGICEYNGGDWAIALSLLKRSPFGEGCDRQFFEIGQVKGGFGYCVTTYRGDGDPLPPFAGEPQLMPLAGNSKKIGEEFWGALDPQNRVALAVKAIHLETADAKIQVWNQYEKK